MNCDLARESILESLDAALSDGERASLDAHIQDCTACTEFLNAQQALDGALARTYVAPPLSAEFRSKLMARVKAERRPTTWDWLPDAVHVAAGVVTTATCAWLFPASGSVIVTAGITVTIGGFLLQAFLSFCLEESEGL